MLCVVSSGTSKVLASIGACMAGPLVVENTETWPLRRCLFIRLHLPVGMVLYGLLLIDYLRLERSVTVETNNN